MEELRVVRDPACRLLSVYLTSPQYQQPKKMMRFIFASCSPVGFVCKYHLMGIVILTDRSTLTTRDAKLIFDAYTSLAFDPCFPRI